jgi:hypothetical protein
MLLLALKKLYYVPVIPSEKKNYIKIKEYGS